MAWLMRRFPRRDSRQVLRFPEDTSIGAVPLTGGEVVPAREAGNVGDVADHGGGDDRAHAEDLGERRPGCLDHHGQLLLRLTHLDAGAAKVFQELGSELAASHLNGPGRLGLLEHRGGFSCSYLLGDAAGDELADDGVQAAGDLVACPAQVTVALCPHFQDRRVVISGHLPRDS